MSNYINLIGTGVAIITPFTKDFDIDYSSLDKNIEFLISNNVDYLVALGSTGEASSLTYKEQNAFIDFLVKKTDNRIPIIVGCTNNSTSHAVERVKELSKFNISGILSAAPYYNKPAQTGIYEHFKLIAKNTHLPVIIYNVPGRTVSNIMPKTCLALACDVDNIIAIKEASGNLLQVMEIVKNNSLEKFIVISGEDALNVPLISVGVKGTISVVANAFPKQVSRMINSALHGDFCEASAIHYDLLKITDLLFKEGNPAGIKALLSSMKMCNNVLRLPLLPVNEDLLNNIYAEYQIIKSKYEK